MQGINKNPRSFDCHLSDFNVSPTGDSTYVRMINTGQHLHVSRFTGILKPNSEFKEIL